MVIIWAYEKALVCIPKNVPNIFRAFSKRSETLSKSKFSVTRVLLQIMIDAFFFFMNSVAEIYR